MSLFDSTGGPDWFLHTNWGSSVGICEWYGVCCFPSNVTYPNWITCAVPDYIEGGGTDFEDTCCRGYGEISSLLLMENNLRASSFPVEILSFSSLRSLFIDGNHLSGELPSSIGTDLPLISILYLYNSSFTGSLPQSFASMANLTVFRGGSNGFSGTIPSSFFTNPNLVSLQLPSNQLSGTLPSATNCPGLQYLVLSSNELSGTLPAQLLQSTALQVLEINSNRFSGNLPLTPSGAPNLERLDVSFNRFEGTIEPLGFSAMCKLQSLLLSDNGFSGILNVSIPTVLSAPCGVGLSLPALGILSFSNNQFTAFPRAPNNLIYLDGHDNLLTTGLEALKPARSLLLIDLSHNRLQGEFPAFFQEFSLLRILSLQENPHFVCGKSLPSSLSPQTALNLNYCLPPFLYYTETYTLFPTYSCPIVSGGGSSQSRHSNARRVSARQLSVGLSLELDPSYYGYCSCPCHRGYWGQAPDCHPCPRGTASGILGARSRQACQPCSARTFAASTAASICLDCPFLSVSIYSHGTACVSLVPALLTGALALVGLTVLGLGMLTVTTILVLRKVVPLLRRQWQRQQRQRLTAYYRLLAAGEVESDLFIGSGDIELRELVGQGASATVYRGLWLGSTEVAVKKYHNFSGMMESGNENEEKELLIQQFRQELEVMAQIRHPHCSLLIGAIVDLPEMALVSEYMPNGSLFAALQELSLSCHHSPASIEINLSRQLNWLAQISSGMHYLHNTLHLIHRDLKSPNVLMSYAWDAIITDFGIAKFQLEGSLGPHYTDTIGTVYWTAPEVLDGSLGHSYASDVYSWAIIACEIFSPPGKGKEIWEGKHPMEVIQKVTVHQQRPTMALTCPRALWSIVQAAWAQSVEDRPSFQSIDAQMHQILSDMNIDAVSSETHASRLPPVRRKDSVDPLKDRLLA
jgi:LRR receptor-like serine/threonine-protein kinase FLS2